MRINVSVCKYSSNERGRLPLHPLPLAFEDTEDYQLSLPLSWITRCPVGPRTWPKVPLLRLVFMFARFT
jgi:hypothetical protein